MPRATAAKRSAQKTEEPQTQTAPPEAPKCFACGRELTWRDRFYVGATAEQCKACHQRDWHKRLGIVGFHPATAMVTKGEKLVEVPVRFNRAARRRQSAPTPPVASAPKRTRAERRAAARQQAARVTTAA